MVIDWRKWEAPPIVMVPVLRSKTPAERLAIMAGLHRLVRDRIAGHLRTIHPNWSDAEIQAEVARRIARGSG